MYVHIYIYIYIYIHTTYTMIESYEAEIHNNITKTHTINFNNANTRITHNKNDNNKT